ncbi:ubiquitin-conjugating enzyme E2-binding protein [Hypoxylon fragiforme]|uniref:ubiquitin-conjugating enzyme E2-binding protein n=1 Tax=Hypoxylon fragiforme TaxID=63214 RepID=UPI0020C6065E|nr:ubiquitin-conjugating enzyme E2-binding protein [Hypoxylon fragiforme]KAI2607546.1 ubiquitin-conjugating enzyme E2-binding protein [Hypoxylon fragiforme]
MSASQPILLYAELLSNIRQVSIGCSLHSPSSSDTQVIVSPDGLEFTVNHDGIKTSIRLPACVSSPQKLSVQNLDTKSLSWRLPLSSTLGQSREFLNASEEQAIPWSASDLQSESPIACRTCHAAIVESGHIKVWKDLPSENWAEMMEFWHCHKPHDHGHGHGDDLTSKGYGASSRISAQSGVGFVDLTSFLLSETDISMSAITHSPPSLESHNRIDDPDKKPQNDESHDLQVTNLPVFCSNCHNQCGVMDSQGSSASFSLFKWQVHVNEKTLSDSEILPTLSHCVSAMLLATRARSGCSKSIMIPMKQQAPPTQGIPPVNSITESESLLNIWVWNTSITFSSSMEARSPIKAMKVFYRMVGQDEANKMLDSMTSDVQDITLPADVINTIIHILRSSSPLLPQSNQQYLNWTVGLLEKWEER